MNEGEWVELIAAEIRSILADAPSLSVHVGRKIPYGFEVLSYGDDIRSHSIEFQTDLAIVESGRSGGWKPRVVVEAKIRRITTHDCITYSQKAISHKSVHPYLRYGVMLGERRHYPLPGRLYRHGSNFDFMLSFASARPTKPEALKLGQLVRAEVEASRHLEKIIYESRKPNRDHYTLLHRCLILE